MNVNDFLAQVEAYAEKGTPGQWNWGEIESTYDHDWENIPEGCTLVDYGKHIFKRCSDGYNRGLYALTDGQETDLFSNNIICGGEGCGGNKHNEIFIAHSRTDIPKLVVLCKRLKEALEQHADEKNWVTCTFEDGHCGDLGPDWKTDDYGATEQALGPGIAKRVLEESVE